MKDRMKEIRKSIKKTQEEFAEFLGISKSNLASYEVGRRTPTDAVISLICQKCEVNEDWLRTGEGDMFIQMDRDEQIASFIGRIQSDAGETFKKRFISMLSSLDESEWEVLEKMALMIYEKKD